jgi:hypothetical protein
VKTFLEAYRDSRRADGSGDIAQILDLLLSNNPEAEKIRAWLKKNARPGIAKELPEWLQGFGGLPCEDWEVELFSLAMHFKCFHGLSAWETASAEERLSHTYKVAKRARKLAEAMEEQPHPYYPPALALFDEEHSIDTINELPEDTARELLSSTPYYKSTSNA